MSTTVSVAGSSYNVPAEGDNNWANDVSGLLIQLATSTKVLQIGSSSFPLLTELSFGTSYGIKLQYLKSQASNPASAGAIRLGNNESIKWRNAANNADLDLTLDASDALQFNGSSLLAGGLGSIVDADVNASAAIAYSKLNLSDSIVNADINSAAAIAYSKLNLATSIVNADINASAAIAYSKLSLSNSILNADINSSAAIAYSKLNLSGSILNADVNASAAIAYSKLNLATSIVNADISGSAAIAYSKLNLATSIVNADISGSAAIAYSKLNLTGNILNADINASAAIARSKVASGSASHVVINDGSGNLSSEAQLAISRGGTGQATKAAAFDALHPMTSTGDMIYSSSGSTSARLPIGSSGQVLKTVGGVPTWATFSGGINYLSSNPDAEADTSGWATYADAAGASPVDGTGGSPTTTWTRTTSSPLRGSASFLLTKDANNRQGEGASFAFTIDASDKGKVLQGSFEYAINSGTFADNDVSVWVYDVTNSVVISVGPYQLKNHTLAAERFGFEFQTSSSSTSYRLILHVASTSASAYTIKCDNFNVGPQAKLYGSPVTEWTQYTPTLSTGVRSGTISYDKAYWRRVGSDMEIIWDYKHTAAGTTGSGNYNFTLPAGYTIDTTKCGAGSGSGGGGTVVGTFNHTYDSNQGSGVCIIASTTQLAAYTDLDSNSSAVMWSSGGTGMFGATNLSFSIRAKVPILGWASSVIMSDSADTRVILAQANGNPASATSGNVIIAPTISLDTHNAYNTSTGRFTAPVAGYYEVAFQGQTAGASYTITIYKNAVAQSVICVQASSTDHSGGSGFVYCSGGDIIDIRPNATVDFVSINLTFKHITGPAQIAMSDTVAFIALPQTATGTLTNSYNTAVLATVNKDTHGAYNTSTGIYTVQSPGYYQVSGGLDISGTYTIGQSIGCRIGNITTSEFHYGFVRAYGSITTDLCVNTSGLIYCKAGDQITLASFVQGSSLSFSTSLTANYLTIARVSR